MSAVTHELKAEDLHAVVRERKLLEQRYKELLQQARGEGWTNTRIARALGVSEAAIRLYWQRHPELTSY